MDVILFLVFAIIAVVCAINVVVQSHPISSALSLVGVMGSLAVLYLLLGAEFIAAAQVIFDHVKALHDGLREGGRKRALAAARAARRAASHAAEAASHAAEAADPGRRPLTD